MSQQAEITDIKKKVFNTGIRVGTHVKTKFMEKFIRESNPEGLYTLDLDITLEKIQTAARFINRVGVENLIVCSGVKSATTPVEKFCECLGAKGLLGRFMPGTLTNPSLREYIEPKLVLISDPQVDQQAVVEATNAGIPIIGIADTDNITSNLDVIIPANNRGIQAIATVYWLLVRQVLIDRGELKDNESTKYEIDDFETKITKEEIE